MIGPVLAAQFGFLPGLLWLVIGVCLGGAVHDFMILAASIRRQGKSLAEIARTEISGLSGFVAGIATLLAQDRSMRGLCTRLGERHLILDPAGEQKARTALRKLGYPMGPTTR